MPREIHALPANTEEVFASPEEFVAHHGGTSLENAKVFLALVPIQTYLYEELIKARWVSPTKS